MKRIALLLAASLGILSVSLATLQPAMVGAAPKDEVLKSVDAIDERDATCGPEGNKRKCTLNDTISTIVNILLFIIGAIAVIMIVVGGLKYTTSNGDSSAVTSAKNTILYAVVGLVVAILAYAIVNFVLNQF